MRNIKLTIEYDGTEYFGWQIQKGRPTIQGEITKALRRILKEEVKLVGAGRTDSGVHALGQVANFKSENDSLDTDDLKKALNGLLPQDIVVKRVEEVPETFHARFSAKTKIYRYQILNQELPSILMQRYCWHISFPLDWEKVEKGLDFFLGKHDYTRFLGGGSLNKNRECTIFGSRLRKVNNLYIIDIEGDHFLYKMVRRMVGVLVEVGRRKIEPEDIRSLLHGGNLPFRAPIAPPQGLFLVKVKY